MNLQLSYEQRLAEGSSKADALYLTLREAIRTGSLNEGDKLPSSRQLAAEYSVSRGSVTAAFDMLYAEGYVRMERGSGTYASYRMPELLAADTVPERQRSTMTIDDESIPLSSWAKRLPAAASPHPIPRGLGPAAILADFRSGQLDPEAFPSADWKRVMYNEIRRLVERQSEDEYQAEGHLPLRQAIAHELRRERGIAALPEDVVITSGSSSALALLAMLLIEPGDSVVLENPCYSGMKRSVQAAGGKIVPAAIDDEGIIPADWKSRLLLVTPNRQFPTGVQLSHARRTELLEWASRQQAYIIEDDYDSEFRWGGRPAEPLKSLDGEGRVIYIGTFTKTMYGDLRIGYSVVPERLRDYIRRGKLMLEPHPSSIAEQRALAAFMGSGQYAKHMRRSRRTFGRRLSRFKEEARKHLTELFRFAPSSAGLHQYATWRLDRPAYEQLRDACEEAGVRWSSGDGYWLTGESSQAPSALFGFSHLEEEQIRRGIEEIARQWDRL
ncbi:PLP-dependent aminotransferase family protein [Paenibacillus sp. GCM10023252]|uniref:MocR-like pyridoxine biosynthesis transcription factor PdxR n=1 Tax=Paenibacillus sp. GCM10023252 TaxID=3252649 RepID=UPI003612B58D